MESGTVTKEPWTRRDAPLFASIRSATTKVLPRTVRFELYWRMLDTPVAAELYTLARGRLRHRRVRPETRVVIEGFPSSGNTFARQAFLLANPWISLDAVCSHTHSPRVVVKGVRAGIPCIVLVRDPREAVSSTVQRFPGAPVANAFDYYARYYRRLLPLRDDIVVAPFTAATGDFGAVLRQCDAKYGVRFIADPDVVLSTEAVFASIEERTRSRHGGQTNELHISRPSSSRLPADLFLENLGGREQRACDRATGIYQEFLTGPSGPTA